LAKKTQQPTPPRTTIAVVDNSDPLNPVTSDVTITDPEATARADWDLSSWRYGTKDAPGILTLRAKGDITFNNALSDGFKTIKTTDDPSIYDNGFLG
jgi:hypothetical protein